MLNFQRRVLQECLTEATAIFWRRRAAEFQAVGTASADEVARACYAKAWVIEWYGDEFAGEDVDDFFEWAAS